MPYFSGKSAIYFLSVLCLGCCCTACPVLAEIITPDSIASPPAPVSPVAQGTPVPTNQVLDVQYAGLGLLIGGAIGEINGTKVWLPTTNPFESNVSLNFASPSFIVAGTNVPGNINAAAQTNLFRAEFIFDPSTNLAPMLQGVSMPSLTTVATTSQFVGTGPHGGMIEQLQCPNMSLFAILGNTSGDTSTPVWGIAQIEIGPVSPVPTPEPGTLLLATLGSLVLLGLVKQRKRCTQTAGLALV